MSASTLTLGELLYADPAIACVPEKEWSALVRAIAAGDESALRVLFEKTYAVMFTFLMRLTGDRRTAEDVILEVLQDVWCEAPVFDGENGPVLGWIMRQARARALSRPARAETSQNIAGAVITLPDVPPPGGSDGSGLAAALDGLAATEREVIEAILVDGLSYEEVAARCGQSVGTVKKRIRSGLSKLQQALRERGDEA